MSTQNGKILKKILDEEIGKIRFLSPNEPITPQGIQRVLDHMSQCMQIIEDDVGERIGKTITMWNPNRTYGMGDMVLYFGHDDTQTVEEGDSREFAFILVSNQAGNTSMPNYDIVDHIPDFTKSGWTLINPTSFLLQDLVGMKEVVRETMQSILSRHVADEHGLIGADSLDGNLLKKDYSNLQTPWRPGGNALIISEQTLETKRDGMSGVMKMRSNGILEYGLRYSFDVEANPRLSIDDRRYYHEKSPIRDESDQTIFSSKYIEDSMFSVNVHKTVDAHGEINYLTFNNLRYGTNIFYAKIELPTPFLNDEYMVFFDTYGNGEFVFGYDRTDLMSKEEPTYDAVVSMPMLMNKTVSGFDVVLPIHTYFNSVQKYNIGVPWNNVFRMQLIGRYR